MKKSFLQYILEGQVLEGQHTPDTSHQIHVKGSAIHRIGCSAVCKANVWAVGLWARKAGKQTELYF